MGLSLAELKNALPENGLFGGGTWQWSPEPLKLTKAEARQIMSIGHPLAQFQKACDALYRQSSVGKVPTWLAQLLDAGKPDWLTRLQKSPQTLGQFPRVIRPDLLLTHSGFSMTELDSVPGGIGMTAWLSQVYARAGFDVLGGSNGMIDGFRSLMPKGGSVLISQESKDYRPEMEWLVNQLGIDWKVTAAENDVPNDQRLYRFFELFDWQAIPAIRELAEKTASGEIQVTPPFKAHLEEKLWLALLWSPTLRKTWEKTMRSSHLQRVRELVPFGWVVDPEPLPPHASLPRLEAHSWHEVAEFSQKHRQLVLKISGFHETAWGSRSVFIGHDLPTSEWAERLEQALLDAQTQPWIVQEFREAKKIEHPIFRSDGSVEILQGRARLCPYFFTTDAGETTFGGCLATIVPADKKKIHGMTDGVLVPCMVEP